MSDVSTVPPVRLMICRPPEEPAELKFWVRALFVGLTVFGRTTPKGFVVTREELISKLKHKSPVAAQWMESNDMTLDFYFTTQCAEETTNLGR